MHAKQRRLSPWLAVLAIFALVCLVGCTLSLTVGPMLPWPVGPILPLPVGEYSRLDVLRTSTTPEVPPFAATVRGTTKINRLLAAIEALPAYPTGLIFCPLYTGVYYHLAFHSTTWPVLQVDMEAGACQGVYFDGTRNSPARTMMSTQFWQLFAQTLSVPVSSLWVVPAELPPYTGPPAPTPSS